MQRLRGITTTAVGFAAWPASDAATAATTRVAPSGDLAPDRLTVGRVRSTLLPATPLSLADPSPYDVVAKALPPNQVPVLAALQRRGLLTVRDRQGVTLLDHLQRLASAPLLTPDPVAERALIDRQKAAQADLAAWSTAHLGTLTAAEQTEKQRLQQAVTRVTTKPFAMDGAAYRAEVLTALLQHLRDPLTETNQGNFGTCAPAIAQRHMITEDPADYARLVAGLFIDGSVVMGQQTYTLNRENLIRVGQDNPDVTSWARDWVDMAVQSSLIDGETPGTYDKVTENMARPDEVAHGVQQGRGLDSNGRLHLQHNLLDADFTFVDLEAAARAGTNEAGLDLLRAELAAATARHDCQGAAGVADAVPEPVFVEIRINWGTAAAPGSHAVAVIGQTATHVLIDNPQGNLFGMYQRSKKYPVLTDPDTGKTYVDLSSSMKLPAGVRIYEDGTTAIPWATMNTHLWGLYRRQDRGPVPEALNRPLD